MNVLCPPYLSSTFLCFIGLQTQAYLLHSGNVLFKRWASRIHGKVGPMGQQGDLGLGEGHPWKILHLLVCRWHHYCRPRTWYTAILWVIILPLLFEWPSFVCLHNLLNLFFCLSKILTCLDSLTLLMISLHSLYNSSSITSFKVIHTCIPLFSAKVNGTVDGPHSFIHQLFLSFLNNYSSPGWFMLFFTLILVGVMFWLKHLRVDLLWFCKSVIFSSFFHFMDRDTIWQKSGVIYRYKCGRVDCEEEYIGESGRIFAERYKEHMKTSSPFHDDHNTTGHDISLTTSTLWEEKIKNWQDPSKKPFSWELVTHALIDI